MQIFWKGTVVLYCKANPVGVYPDNRKVVVFAPSPTATPAKSCHFAQV